MNRVRMLEPEPQIEGDLTHSGGICRESIVTSTQNRATTSDGHMIENVLRLNLQVDAAVFSEAEDTTQRTVQIEGGRTRDGIPAGVAPQPCRRLSKRRGVEQLARAFDRQAGCLRAHSVGDSRATYLRSVATDGRGERSPRPKVDVAANGPILN